MPAAAQDSFFLQSRSISINFPIGIITVASNDIDIISFFFGNRINVYLFFTFHHRDEFIKFSGQLHILLFNSTDPLGGRPLNMPLGMIFLHII